LSLLAAEAYRAIEIDALLGRATVHVVRGERLLPGRAGDVISLLALHGPADGVVTDGLVYPLHGETCCLLDARALQHLRRLAGARLGRARAYCSRSAPNSFAQERVIITEAAGIGFFKRPRCASSAEPLPLAARMQPTPCRPRAGTSVAGVARARKPGSLPLPCAGWRVSAVGGCAPRPSPAGTRAQTAARVGVRRVRLEA